MLSMALRRLTSLEAGKLREEEATLAQTLAQLQSLLGSQQLVLDTVKRESQEIADKFGDSRRTAVRPPHGMRCPHWLMYCYGCQNIVASFRGPKTVWDQGRGGLLLEAW